MAEIEKLYQADTMKKDEFIISILNDSKNNKHMHRGNTSFFIIGGVS